MDTKDQQPASDGRVSASEETMIAPESGTTGEAEAEPHNGAETETLPAVEELSPEALQEQLTEQRRQAEEYLDLLQRKQAEFDNYRRRMSQDLLQAAGRGKKEVLQALLPILGNFRLALQHAEKDANAVRQGVQMIWQQFEGFLHDQGVERIETVGHPFDPAKHEALSTAPATDDAPANTIVAEINAGYVVDGRLLCPAQVIVARAEEPSAVSETEGPPNAPGVEA
jgi:molecular chaperone GrpE